MIRLFSNGYLEANIILEKISDKILSESKVENSIFKSLLEWGACRESLYISTVNCLNELTGNNITFSVIPRVKTFMDNSNKKQEITEIVYRWVRENDKLRQAVEKNFQEV